MAILVPSRGRQQLRPFGSQAGQAGQAATAVRRRDMMQQEKGADGKNIIERPGK